MKVPLVPMFDGSTPKAFTDKLDNNLKRLAVRYEPVITRVNYTFLPSDEIDSLQVDATAGNVTITLPSPTGNRRRTVIKTDASANTVTVSAGTNLINGVTSHVLSIRYGNITVEPTGTSWLIVGWNTQVKILGGSIDNTPIGATTPNTGAFTTLSATGAISSTATAAALSLSGATTSARYVNVSNTGGQMLAGVENSTGAAFGATAYDSVLQAATGTGLAMVINGMGVVGRFTSTGLAVTGVADINGTAASATVGHLQLGSSTQSTIGANGAASALTANPLGYLVGYLGTTKIIIPYYNA